MSEEFFTVNPLWWLHSRLSGGPRKIVWQAAAYSLACVGAMAAIYQIEPLRTGGLGAFVGLMIKFLGGVQVVVMLLMATSNVHTAVVRDFTTRMMESHRISPISPATAVGGYLLGPNLRWLAIFGCGAVLGVIMSGIAGLPIGNWALAMGLLLLMSAYLWSASVLSALSTGKGGNPIIGLVIAGSMGGFMLVRVVPGLGLAGGLYGGLLAVSLSTGISNVSPSAELSVTFIIVAVMSITWFLAAMRKYARPELPAFQTGWALALLMEWLIVCVIAANLKITNGPNLGNGVSFTLTMVGTALVTFLVAGLAISAATWATTQLHRSGAPRRLDRSLLVAVVTALGCAAAFGAMAYLDLRAGGDAASMASLVSTDGAMSVITRIFGASASESGLAQAMVRTLPVAMSCLALAFFLVAVSRMKHILRVKSGLIVLALALLCGLGPLVDMARSVVANPGQWPAFFEFSWLSGLSPAGTVAIAYSDSGIHVWPGILGQWAAAVALLAFSSRLAARWRRAQTSAETAAMTPASR